MVKLPSSPVNPHNRMLHSVVNTTTIRVRPRAENPNRFKNVIKKPKPPTNIIWMSSMATEENSSVFCIFHYKYGDCFTWVFFDVLLQVMVGAELVFDMGGVGTIIISDHQDKKHPENGLEDQACPSKLGQALLLRHRERCFDSAI